MFTLVVFLASLAFAWYLSPWYLAVWLLASFAGFSAVTWGPLYSGPWLLASLIGGVWLAGWWSIPVAILSFASGTQVAREKNRTTD